MKDFGHTLPGPSKLNILQVTVDVIKPYKQQQLNNWVLIYL